MTASMVIVFREALEAALVIGIVLAATRGLPRSRLWIMVGGFFGIVGAGVVAALAETISQAAAGIGQELFNAVVLLTAAGVLAWTVVWMREHGRAWSARMTQVGRSVAEGDASAGVLAIVVGLAVLREGAEVVLFLYGIASGGMGAGMVTGGLAGLLLGAMAGGLMYVGLLRIPARHLFSVIAALLTLLAAGMASQGAAFLVMADVLPALAQPLWDTSSMLPQQSLVGQVLHALAGYSDRPSGMQALAFAVTLLLVLWAVRGSKGRTLAQ